MGDCSGGGGRSGVPESGPRWARQVTLRVFGRELRILSRTERATRDLLANVVYRVPPEWLDRILEARLSDLDR